MKKFILALSLVLVASASAFAEENYIVTQPPSGKVIDLPGNVHIVPGGGGPNGVVIQGDDRSLLYRTLVAPYSREKNLYVPGRGSLSYIASVCGPARQDREYNKCMKEAIKAQEDLRRKYN